MLSCRPVPRLQSAVRALLLCALACTVTLPALAQAPAKKPAGAKARPAPAPSAKPATPAYATRSDAMQAADDIAERRNLDPQWVRAAIGQARLLPQVARLVLPAASGAAKNWQAYRSRFIDPVRIAAGVAFWREHAAALARAEAEYGVPAEIIVGIIGVETIYGRNMGGFRVLDALATLSFDFPKAHPRAADRQAFFRGELEQLLSLAQRTGTDPASYRGSYAGAMGLPQFMPSSWVKYAVDFDGDGKIDLFGSPDDAIGSVANYFKAFGWQTGMPTHYAVRLESTPAQLDELLAPDILPTFTASSMSTRGALLDDVGKADAGLLALVELKNGDAAPTFVAGTENFYVITRYNWSSYYAMAVIDLGQEVAKAREQREPTHLRHRSKASKHQSFADAMRSKSFARAKSANSAATSRPSHV